MLREFFLTLDKTSVSFFVHLNECENKRIFGTH